MTAKEDLTEAHSWNWVDLRQHRVAGCRDDGCDRRARVVADGTVGRHHRCYGGAGKVEGLVKRRMMSRSQSGEHGGLVADGGACLYLILRIRHPQR